MPIPLELLRRQPNDPARKVQVERPTDFKLSIPLNLKVTGKEGYFRCQWSPVQGADGYQVAVSTAKDMDNPDIGTFVVVGTKQLTYDYLVGNVALTRNFAVRAFQGWPPRFYSDFCSVASATNALTGAAGSTEPSTPSPVPTTQEPPPTGTQTSRTGRGDVY